jgi:predicted DNA-binding transcriptional regulator YafY
MYKKPAGNTDHIQTILDSIAQKKLLTLDYFAAHSQEATKRDVEPVGIFYADSFWHLIAYCRLRNDYRDFRVDRMRKAVIGDASYNHSKHPTLKAYIDQTAKEKQLETVIIRVDKDVVRYLDHQKYYSGFVSEKAVGNKTEMTFLTRSIEGFACWFMMYGDHAEIVKPQELTNLVKAKAAAIIQKNN